MVNHSGLVQNLSEENIMNTSLSLVRPRRSGTDYLRYIDISRLCSRWSSSYIAALSLVDGFIGLFCHEDTAQGALSPHLLGALDRNTSRGHFLPFACSFWLA